MIPSAAEKLIWLKRNYLTYPYQFVKTGDLCVGFYTSQGASVRRRCVCSPLQKLEKVAFATFSTRFPRRDLYPFRGFFILGQKENVKFVEIPRANGYFFPVFLL